MGQKSFFAGVLGFEPKLMVLETIVLPLTLHPQGFSYTKTRESIITGFWFFALFLGFFVVFLVLAASFAELFDGQLVAILATEVAVSVVVVVLAFRALQPDEIVLRHRIN